MSDARKSALRELKAQNKLPHVGIVGAGISGLRCADTLIRNGFHVTILEARERIGGRVSIVLFNFAVALLSIAGLSTGHRGPCSGHVSCFVLILRWHMLTLKGRQLDSRHEE